MNIWRQLGKGSAIWATWWYQKEFTATTQTQNWFSYYANLDIGRFLTTYMQLSRRKRPTITTGSQHHWLLMNRSKKGWRKYSWESRNWNRFYTIRSKSSRASVSSGQQYIGCLSRCVLLSGIFKILWLIGQYGELGTRSSDCSRSICLLLGAV